MTVATDTTILPSALSAISTKEEDQTQQEKTQSEKTAIKTGEAATTAVALAVDTVVDGAVPAVATTDGNLSLATAISPTRAERVEYSGPATNTDVSNSSQPHPQQQQQELQSQASPRPALSAVAVAPSTSQVSTVTTDDSKTTNQEKSKRKERLEQNRISARESRKRKKTMIEELQRTVIALTSENKELNGRNQSLRAKLAEIGQKVSLRKWRQQK